MTAERKVQPGLTNVTIFDNELGFNRAMEQQVANTRSAKSKQKEQETSLKQKRKTGNGVKASGNGSLYSSE